MIDLKKTSIKIPIDVLIEIKAMAVKQGTSQNTIINDLINKGMGKRKGKLKAKIINDKFPKVKVKNDKYKNFEDMAGFIKVDNPEKIDVQELKDSIHYKKELY
jgi:hypothetical protein